jgi:hypothetical protein
MNSQSTFTRNRTIICLGGHENVWTELDQALALCPDADIAACNEAGRDYPGRLSLWCSLHPEKLGEWQRRRKGPPPELVISHQRKPQTRIDTLVKERWPGSSGLYTVQNALSMGYCAIICAGMPYSVSQHYHKQEPWQHANGYHRGWKRALPHIRDKVKSMSGWTAELLGKPDAQWLERCSATS